MGKGGIRRGGSDDEVIPVVERCIEERRRQEAQWYRGALKYGRVGALGHEWIYTPVFTVSWLVS